MDWDISELKEEKSKEEKKEKPIKKGKAAIMNLAREEMARVLSKQKKKDPRIEALKRAAEEWEKKKEMEEREKRQREEQERREKSASPIEIMKIEGKLTEGEAKDKKSEPEIVDWVKQGMESWKKKTGIQLGKKKVLRPNSAMMGVIVRRAIMAERTIAFGKKLPDPRVVALEREVAQLEFKKQAEELRKKEETEMVKEFVQLLVGENLLQKEQKEQYWAFGKVKFFINNEKDGWDVQAEVLERSNYLVRSGWGDLLGVYNFKVGKDLNLLYYNRVSESQSSGGT